MWTEGEREMTESRQVIEEGAVHTFNVCYYAVCNVAEAEQHVVCGITRITTDSTGRSQYRWPAS